MVSEKQRVLEAAKKLPAMDRAELIEGLLNSFHLDQRKNIDEAWSREAESRIDAYDAGKIESIPMSKVFEDLEREYGA
jgi:putative addiction module component (TIGR02574 family)